MSLSLTPTVAKPWGNCGATVDLRDFSRERTVAKRSAASSGFLSGDFRLKSFQPPSADGNSCLCGVCTHKYFTNKPETKFLLQCESHFSSELWRILRDVGGTPARPHELRKGRRLKALLYGSTPATRPPPPPLIIHAGVSAETTLKTDTGLT